MARHVWACGSKAQPLVSASASPAVAERVGGRQVVGVFLCGHDGHVLDNDLGLTQSAPSIDADRGFSLSRRTNAGKSKKKKTHGNPP